MNKNLQRPITVALISLAFIEAILALSSIYAGLLLSSDGATSLFSEHWLRMTLIGVTFSLFLSLSYAAFGLYSRDLLARQSEQLPRLILACFFTLLVVALLSYMVPLFDLGAKQWLIISTLNFFLVLLARHIVINRVSQELFNKRILVLGAGQKALQLKEAMEEDGSEHIVQAYINLRGERARIESAEALFSIGSLYEYAKENSITEIVVAVDDRRNGFPLEQLLQCRLNGIDVTDLLYFYERELGQIKLDVLDPSWLIFSSGFKQDTVNNYTKRVVDLLVSGIVLVSLSPLFCLCYLGLLMQNRSRQDVFRGLSSHGLAGSEFKRLSFNTIKPGLLNALIVRLKLTHLPAWLNVFKGDMSFIGPRAMSTSSEVSSQDKRLAYFSERHMVKPGICGWAGVMQGKYVNLVKDLHYDLYYVKNNSLYLDFLIVMKYFSKLFKTGHMARPAVVEQPSEV